MIIVSKKFFHVIDDFHSCHLMLYKYRFWSNSNKIRLFILGYSCAWSLKMQLIVLNDCNSYSYECSLSKEVLYFMSSGRRCCIRWFVMYLYQIEKLLIAWLSLRTVQQASERTRNIYLLIECRSRHVSNHTDADKLIDPVHRLKNSARSWTLDAQCGNWRKNIVKLKWMSSVV